MQHLWFTDAQLGYVFVKDSVDSPERAIHLIHNMVKLQEADKLVASTHHPVLTGWLALDCSH